MFEYSIAIMYTIKKKRIYYMIKFIIKGKEMS